MDGVDRNVAEGQVLVEVLVGADVATTGFEPHLDVQAAAFADGSHVNVAIEHFDVGVGLDLSAANIPWSIDAQTDGLGSLPHDLEGDLFQVQDDVGGVFHDAGNGTEFVLDAFDANGGDGRAFNRAEQYAAEAIADCGSETALERLGSEHAVTLGEGFGVGYQTLWFLKAFEHRVLSSPCRIGLLACLRVKRAYQDDYFEYNSTINCSFN